MPRAGRIQQRRLPRLATPMSIPNCQGWYAADSIGVAYADAGSVDQWNDLSGAGRNLTQGTAGSRPTYRLGVLNGRPIVRFDGTDDYLAASSGFSAFSGADHASTFIAVVKAANTTQFANVASFGRNSNGNPKIRYYTNGSNGYRMQTVTDGGTLRQPATSSITPNTNWDVNVWMDSGTAFSFRQNGVLSTQASSVTSAGEARTIDEFAIAIGYAGTGTAEPFNGDIAEFAIYNTKLGDPEVQAIERYLGYKYGIRAW